MLRLVALLVLAALAASPLAAQKAELFVLSVGVEKYSDASLNLNYCADDARDLAAALQRQTDLYQVMEVKVLTDAQATRSAIRTELDGFKKKVTANDLFVFIFSGHGIEDGLVPYDFDINDPSATTLNKLDLRQKLGALGCNYIVLLDACHSGSFTKQVTGKNVVNDDAFALAVERASRQLAEALAGTDKNSIVVSSSASDQLSFECSSCGHGYFAQAVLDCIAGKTVTDPNTGRVIRPVTDAGGMIGALAFENYITEAVRVMTLRQPNPQKVRVLRSTGGDFPLLRTTAVRQPSPNPTTGSATRPDPVVPAIRDDDHDGFADDKDDDCPGEYGTLRGCPDTDGDGVADKYDACPFEAGTAANRGCPVRDADGDGVVDDVDKCKYLPGKKEWQGCPDSDGDSIPDHLDECPSEKGTAARKGCPDPAVTSSSSAGVGMIIDPLVGTFVLVKGGTVQLSDSYTATLSTYYMGQTEVTQAQWRTVMGTNPSNFKNCDDCPVENVSWIEVQDFITKLNSLSGGTRYRLPTEAEWEYAARGGSQSRGYEYAGSSNINEVAWYYSNSGGKSGKTRPVKGKQANELGLYDMTGNVWEWCSDWYDSYPSGSRTNPTGPTSGSNRVIRGGSWNNYPQFCRVSYRYSYSPDRRNRYLGFRLARTP